MGQQVFAGEATRLAYGTDEAAEGATRSWPAAAGLVAVPLAVLMRALRVVDAADPAAVHEALRDALAGGSALAPSVATRPKATPTWRKCRVESSRCGPVGAIGPQEVEQRVAVVVETSGSTGRAKRVALSADAVLASAASPPSRRSAVPASGCLLSRSTTSPASTCSREPSHPKPNPCSRGVQRRILRGCGSAMTGSCEYTSLVPVQLARLIEEDAGARPPEALRPHPRAGDRPPRSTSSPAHSAGAST